MALLRVGPAGGLRVSFDLNPGQQKALDETLTTDARFMLLYGGSRSGKSALLCSCVLDRALIASHSRHLVVRKEGTAAKRAIVKDTLPTIWRLKFPGTPDPQWREQDGVFILPNGSEIWVGGLNDDKALEKLLGNEYATIWANELSEINYHAFTLLRSRLAQTVKRNVGSKAGELLPQRFYGDLNPTTRMHWTYRLWQEGIDPVDQTPVGRDQYRFSVINPYDNRQNLSGDYLADLEALPDRAKRRFLHGEYISDDDRALWLRSFFKRARLTEEGRLPVDMRRIIVAIDPAASDEPGADETGIITAGLGTDGYAYVIEDQSGRFRPEEWARRAISSYRRWSADRVIGEKNNGGDMVESVLRAQDATVSYRAVWASRGKITRAEPAAALYEQGKVFHMDGLSDLEDQCCSVTPGFDRTVMGWSPDRVDALVWALTDLFPELAAPRMAASVPAPQFSMV